MYTSLKNSFLGKKVKFIHGHIRVKKLSSKPQPALRPSSGYDLFTTQSIMADIERHVFENPAKALLAGNCKYFYAIR